MLVRKNFIFGLGSGIIAMSLVMLCLYNFSYKPLLSKTLKPAITHQEVEEMAYEMGMIYAKDLPEENTQIVSSVSSQKELPKYVEVNIPEGANASEISVILEENNVVDNADDFKDYLKVKNATKKIKYGTFEFPINARYEEIASVCIE